MFSVIEELFQVFWHFLCGSVSLQISAPAPHKKASFNRLRNTSKYLVGSSNKKLKTNSSGSLIPSF